VVAVLEMVEGETVEQEVVFEQGMVGDEAMVPVVAQVGEFEALHLLLHHQFLDLVVVEVEKTVVWLESVLEQVLGGERRELILDEEQVAVVLDVVQVELVLDEEPEVMDLGEALEPLLE
jgi:enolase